MALELTDANFSTEVLANKGVSVVDFWAVWCGPCRMVAPIIEELSHEYADRVIVGKLDVDHNPEIATKYGIRSIPTILILKDGQVVDKQVGFATKQALANKINEHLS